MFVNLIAFEPTIRKTRCHLVSRKEENDLRNSKHTFESIQATLSGIMEAKQMNYWRIAQAIPVNGDEATKTKDDLIPNGKCLLDWDIHDAEHSRRLYDEKIKGREKELGVLHAEFSVRGGLHVTVRLLGDLNHHWTIRWWEHYLDVELDHSMDSINQATYLVTSSYVFYCSDEYYWTTVEPIQLEIPQTLLDEMEHEQQMKQRRLAPLAQTTTEQPRVDDEYVREYDNDYDELDNIVNRYILPSGVDIAPTEPEWFSLCCLCADIQGEDGREPFLRMSSRYPDFKYEEANKKFDHCLRHGYSGYSLGTLLHLARKYGAIK